MSEVTKSPEPVQTKVSLRHVSKTFRTKHGLVRALAEINLDVADGEFLCLVGPSGCGKSTLLNIIAGLEQTDSGQVLVDGKPVTGPGSDRMVMFQEPALFPWLDAFQNVMFALRLKRGLSRAERREVAEFYLNLVGLSEFKTADVHELSGGMKQRVALARALAPNPKILLMDEPFASLDALTREQLYCDLQNIWLKRKKTVLFVTHNPREAACLADRVVVFTARPGRVKAMFQISLPHPRNMNSAEVAEWALQITDALRQETPDSAP